MAGRGFAPSGKRGRARDNDVRETVKSDGKLGGYDLPAGVLGANKDGSVIEWHPMTVKWWDNWRRSPQGTVMLTDVDWDFLLDTALMHHTMWMNGKWEFASEIRLRVAKFGATPDDRARLKFDIEVPEKYPVGASGNETNVTRLDERRNRWGA